MPPIRIAFGQFADWEGYIHANLSPRFEPSFVDLAEASLDAFDAVIPLLISNYEALGRHPELRGRRFFHPSAEVTALCDDKLRLTQFLIAEGFAAYTPPLRALGAPYPYVWKRRWGGWGEACWFVGGPEDERALDLTDPHWFAQAWTPGPVEYATHVLRVGGRTRYASTFAYEMGAEGLVRGQRHAPRETRFEPGCSHLDLFEAMLARLGYEGTACLNYKVEAGRPLIFEINPRYGGSLCGDVTAYVEAYLAALDKS